MPGRSDAKIYLYFQCGELIKFFALYLQNLRLKNTEIFFYYFIQCEAWGKYCNLAASSTSKGPQVKTTEPMVSIKVTNCSIQLG